MEIEGREATEVNQALDAWTTAQDHLISLVEDGGLDGLDDQGFVGFLQRFEQGRNRVALVDHRAVRDLGSRRLPEKVTQPNVAATLAWALHLSRGEAARRVRAAEQVGERVTMTGEPLPPLRPALAAAQRQGLVSPEQVDVCARALASVDHRGFDPADLDLGDQLLAQNATSFAPESLRVIARQIVDRIDPDGTRPQEDLNADRRHLELRKTPDGMYACEARLTGCGRGEAPGGPGPARQAPHGDDDDRRRAGGGGRGPAPPRPAPPRRAGRGVRPAPALRHAADSGGTPASVIITIGEHDLQARKRWGVTSDGTVLSAEAVVGLADEAELHPTVVNSLGGVLQLGRTRRLASCGQTMALIARDGGCSFPGCDRPPEWSQRHHVVDWVAGGKTDLSNLTLVCAFHHHNFASRGWACVMIDDLPAWGPPKWIDREQRPILNARVLARQHGLGLRS